MLQVFEGSEMIRMATLPDMWERTITIGSAGKTFSVTGWKLGWAVGPSNLIGNCQIVHQNAVYTCPTPIQEAVARGFELELARMDSPECYFKVEHTLLKLFCLRRLMKKGNIFTYLLSYISNFFLFR